uniref:Mitochondrial fission process protein 1 n=1 Tax=Ixodes ricinus TaxID=34613 RepID=V5HV85_IXORI
MAVPGGSEVGKSHHEPSVQADQQKEVDIYRDTPVRLLGYANELGEAFRSLVHVNVVRLTYAVASAYVPSGDCRQGRQRQTTNKVRRNEATPPEKAAGPRPLDHPSVG